MGQPLYCSAAYAGLCGERGYGDGSTRFAWASSIPLLPGPPGFPPQALPITISSLTSPRSISLQATAAPALGLLQEPSTPAPSSCAFWGTCRSVQGMYVARTVWLSFHLGCTDQLFTLSLKCFSSDSDNCLAVGIGPLLQFPYLLRAGPVLLTLLFFPFLPTSYRVLHGSIFSFPLVRSSYQLWTGVLVALLSEGVFLMYPWRKMYPTFTYSSAILFSLIHFWMLIQLWVLEIKPMWPLFEILFFPVCCLLQTNQITAFGSHNVVKRLTLPWQSPLSRAFFLRSWVLSWIATVPEHRYFSGSWKLR